MAQYYSNGCSKLEATISSSIRQLGNQTEGSKFKIAINTIVTIKAGKSPLRRVLTCTHVHVSLSELTHVSVKDSDLHGKCVRLVFQDKLYATCGEDAEKIIAWAQRVTATKISSKIEDFPAVSFQQVLDAVKIQEGELMAA